jgi:hypothetical protein
MRWIAPVVVAGALFAACGSGGGGVDAVDATAASTAESGATPFGPGAFPYAASSNLAVGEERVLVAITNDRGERLPSPDIPVDLVVWLDGRDFQQQTVPASFLWAIPDVSGLYRATVEFDTAGTWYIGVVPRGSEPLSAFPVTVYEEPFTPGVGDPAPRSATLTLADAPLEELTTDIDPEPAFYEMSIADAVGSGRPSVIVFATPRFCTTGICQPTMELMRDLAPQYPGANFLHVEVFTNLDDPANLELAPGIEEWGLPTEPWVFVVDGDGLVAGRFEGLVTPEELEALIG